MFGFDVMFVQQLKCWLIEVNSSPSLSCDSCLDTRIKGRLIRDTIALVEPPAYDRKSLADICRRRLTHRKARVSDTLEQDLARIMNGTFPRPYGVLPTKIGNFERIAPGTNLFDRLSNRNL